MGFSDGRIILNSENGAYYPGQVISGRLEFDQETVKTFRGIYVKIKGFCKIHWTTHHTRRENDRDVSYTVTHESYEEYIRQKIYLAGSDSGDHHLQPGHHSFSFEYPIPANCPSSFEDSDGHIRYQIKVVVDRAFKIDQEKYASFRIIAPIDLNSMPAVREPISFDLQQSFCCWCISSGSAMTVVKLPVSGFCPGQVMPIEVGCTNNSNVEIERIAFTLIRETTLRAERHPDTRHRSEDIGELYKGPIPGNNSRNWTVEMNVPTIDVPNLDSCSYIDIKYLFKVHVQVPSCHEDETDSCYITIGTIPLSGYQDNVANPLQDQMPKVQDVPQNTCYPPPPVTTQSLPGTYPTQYPGNPPYNGGYPGVNPQFPSANPQYPGANPQYPGANPPYPGANPQYPGANPPYPGANPQYPGANPPYPGANPQYPGANPPYPGANPQYPGTNPPYPGANPQYPAQNPQFPSANSQYPAPNPQYPGVMPQYPGANQPFPNNSPYQGNQGPNINVLTTGAHLVKSGDGQDPAAMPLLPPGGLVPNPRSSSPYPPPSAPEPSTPDLGPSPAYNPNYHENKQN